MEQNVPTLIQPGPPASDTSPLNPPPPVLSDSSAILPSDNSVNNDVVVGTRKSSRISVPPRHLADYQVYLLNTSTAVNPSVKYPLHSITNYDKLSPACASYCMNISTVSEPKTYASAIKDPHWLSAMNDELNALDINNTWDLVELPNGIKPIGSNGSIK
jgi:hypothetical protein